MKWPFSNQVTQKPSQSVPSSPFVKLDLGCGKFKKDGFLGIDRRRFEGVDAVTDLTQKKWIFEQPQLGPLELLPGSVEGSMKFTLPDCSITEGYCSHFLEHLEHNQRQPERARFMNELWRVLIPGGVATIITPYWASNRAYGDFTHADKPVTEMFYLYLDKDWRKDNASDNDIEFNPDGYDCDFEHELGHGLHPDFAQRPKAEQEFALQWYKDAVLELHARLTARK